MNLKKAEPSSLWRYPGYISWFTTDTSFALSSAINGFVLSILVLTQTGSASHAGIVSSITLVTAGILHILGGWIQDAWDRRKVAFWNGISGIVLYAAGIVLLSTDTFTFVTASILAFALGIRSGLCANVTNVMLRAFIPGNILPKAISVNQARDAVIEFGTSPFAGALLQLGYIFPYAFNIISNLLGSIASLFLPRSISVAALSHKKGSHKSFSIPELLAGFETILSIRLLRVVTTSGNIAINVFNAVITATIWHTLKSTGNAATAGIANSIVAVGVLIGAAIATRLTRAIRGSIIVLLGYVLPLASTGLLLMFHSSVAHLLLLAPALLLLPAGSAVLGSLQLLIVPDERLGRTTAATGILELIFGASITAANGFLYEHFGYTNTLLAGVIIMALCLLHLSLVSEIRAIPTSNGLEEFSARITRGHRK
ncbi:MFS transporter [Cutibacterium sp.]|uniref:MFS transporter n=1 Tax=Cutibacterium sp. TaxID=1912221 RepID=UPI0026DBAE93|nr:MFS transporter [Cutibacterium sp.]MDO4413138.1 MFS transporter [Cutibacterium sp.]